MEREKRTRCHNNFHKFSRFSAYKISAFLGAINTENKTENAEGKKRNNETSKKNAVVQADDVMAGANISFE